MNLTTTPVTTKIIHDDPSLSDHDQKNRHKSIINPKERNPPESKISSLSLRKNTKSQKQNNEPKIKEGTIENEHRIGKSNSENYFRR